MELELKDVIKATDAVVLKNVSDNNNYSFSTDTRTIKKGEIFIPVKGENFDGENFIQNALESGANGYFTTSDKVFENAQIVLKVKDTLTAYLEIAKLYKEKVNPKVVAITGSSGKTTTKEMMSSIVSEKFRTHKTALNHNNEIGFCQTLLSMPSDTEILIVEMGMRGFGEIELLSKYANPDVSVVTNVGTAHIGRLGSRENIAKAKCEIVKFMNLKGIFITENDDLVRNTVEFNGKKNYTDLSDVEFLEKNADYTKFLYKNNEFIINVSGDYNVKNALLCIETALSLGMSAGEIEKGLLKYTNIEKRFETQTAGGFNIINDSYNANPDSVKCFLKNVFELYKNPVIVLGNMGELGEKEEFYHREIGDFINLHAPAGVKILTVGNAASYISNTIKGEIFSKNFESTKIVACYILDNINNSNTIFLKASRSERFEEIIKYLKGDIL